MELRLSGEIADILFRIKQHGKCSLSAFYDTTHAQIQVKPPYYEQAVIVPSCMVRL